ncbi:unnamed protein product [Mycena citricolor]|uniref:Major facilitator superfamily (MFS) profile domain-containing protein n=1 Tax=Mycena citricolor TaxID=2018698 RepID=A0AAD2GY04_9AGAR|nr:unnamed protein product [Mycena citricolor]
MLSRSQYDTPCLSHVDTLWLPPSLGSRSSGRESSKPRARMNSNPGAQLKSKPPRSLPSTAGSAPGCSSSALSSSSVSSGASPSRKHPPTHWPLYGVFQEFYLNSPQSPFRGASEASINSIGTITIGIQYFEGLGVMALTQRYPRWTKSLMGASLAACVGALLVSSFATKVWQLILLQGVLYGVAGGLNEWFVERRAFAASIIFGGSGLGGALFPVVTNYVLQRYGFRWALRSLALIVGVLGLVALLGAKPRLPVARHSTPAPLTFQFVRSPLFVLVALAVFVQALAYFPVSLYIPTYAASLGYSPGNGTLALTVFNLAAVIGECQVLVGYYCDRGPYSTAMLGSSLVAAGLAFLLWGYAHSLSLIVLFSVLFGAVSGGFSSVWPPAAKEVYADQSLTPFFLFSGAKGLAAISGPFIAASLHPRNGSVSRASWAGYGFTAVEIFVGSMMFATAILSAVLVIVREKTMKDRVE